MLGDPALVVGILIGVALAGVVYLIVTGRLRFSWRGGDDWSPSGRTTRVTVTRRAADPEEARELLPSLTDATAQRFVFNINGEVYEYDSLEEVPADFRALMERARSGGQSQIVIEVNGQRHTYNSRDEVPPEFRRFLPPGP